jgi:hypothetical protein
MTNDERKLQEEIAAGRHTGDDESSRAYKQLFKSLEKAPAYRLPDNFADRIVLQVQAKQVHSSNAEFFLLAAGVVLLLICLLVTLALTGFVFEAGFLSAIAAYKGLFLFGAVFIGFLHWLDKRFIRTKQSTA